MGMDELFAYKRNAPRDLFHPIPVYLTATSWDVVRPRFGYLEEMGVIKIHPIDPGAWIRVEEFEVFPFKTSHGNFAKGSVGFLIRFIGEAGEEARLLYTSDFADLPDIPVFIDRIKPRKETFLVHMGDADMVRGDPANVVTKKYEPKDPLKPLSGGEPYPIPLSQSHWQRTVEQIMSDRKLPYKVVVAHDDLKLFL